MKNITLDSDKIWNIYDLLCEVNCRMTGTNETNSEKRLSEKVALLHSVMNVQRVISGEKNSPKEISSYFRLNRLAYRRFHSEQGFMHFRVSKNGEFSENDVYYQPDVVSALIPRHARVLELGYGQAANLYYLAERHPDAFFCGVDLQPTNRPHNLSNVRLLKQDYSDLSNFPENAFDVAYAIETIVYSSRKDEIFRQIYRVLKPGGVLVVYDYSLPKAFENYSQAQKTAITLISKGGAGALIESAAQWEAHFTLAGFQKRSVTDLSQETLPDLKRLDRKADHILRRPALSKLIFRLLPYHFVNNIVLGYLGYDAVRAGMIGYTEWIYEKTGSKQ